MSIIYPFVGLLPQHDLAKDICSPPYDVMNKAEAKEMVSNNPKSFLKIIRPEVNLEEENTQDNLHEVAKHQLNEFIKKGYLNYSKSASFYIYQIIDGTHTQTGVVAGASIDEYDQNTIKKHELTRPDKEKDRTDHILAVGAQTGPVFLTYKQDPSIKAAITELTKENPQIEFKANDGIVHKLWVISDTEHMRTLKESFKKVPNLYVADGHHRSAAASNARTAIDSLTHVHSYEHHTHFLSVIFPSEELKILDYNRVIKDLNGHSVDDIMSQLSNHFTISSASDHFDTVKPSNKNECAMFISDSWYKLTFNKSSASFNVVDQLAVSILQNYVLQPIFGITNPRTDSRIDFVGGIRGYNELEVRCKKDAKCAFRLYPTTIDELMEIADNNELMPPKSTWFEPKLRSGLVIKSIQKINQTTSKSS